jgi:dTMP kinase
MTLGLGKEKVEAIHKVVVGEDWPSLTVLFDLDPKVGLERIGKNNRETNRFDSNTIDFHNSVRKSYLELEKENDRMVKIDASKDIDEVFEQVIKVIEEHIND